MPEPKNESPVRVIAPEGHVRTGDKLDWFRSEIESTLSAGNARLVVDMSGVTSLDSSAVGVLVHSLTQSKQTGGNLKLAAVPPKAERVMKITGVLKLFEVFASSADAVSSFS